ncbi:uncharacterized protein LOC143891689 [Tasmannia lanceolata]|uniref:uncharacterized protein LOC143891689 n=1 Tax=Tasmannia lanceolata TaxID=3420 RepID=UPI0040637D18
MKTKSSVGFLREGNSLHACHQSNKISKSSRFQVKISQQAALLDSSIQNQKDVSSKIEASDWDIQFQNSPLSSFDSPFVGRLGSLRAACPSILGAIFSPIFEPNEVHCEPINHNFSGTNAESSDVAVDDSDAGSSSSSDYRTCNVTDFKISDMSIASLSFDGNAELDDLMTANPCPNYDPFDPDLMFDTIERYMVLPFLEETVETSNFHDGESFEEAAMYSGDTCLYLAIQQMKSSDQKTEINYHSVDPDDLDGFDPHLFIRNVPDLAEVVPSLWPVLLPKNTQIRKSVTLVLDLDETLIHSTLEHCDDANFTFPVYYNMKEHTVYVRRRPYLQIFLEKVAEMFEIIVFTASQSIYAEQLLNILDPEQKLISRRIYRESCIFSDGNYMKDLTVLGLDLEKVAIIDNSPQVFRLQVNNGIPIQSWFDDPSDCELISLLPFLETLVDSDDVRPIIAKRFGNKE